MTTDPSPREAKRIKDEYARRRFRQILLVIPFVPMMVVLFLLDDGGPILGLTRAIWGPVFLALVVGALIFSFMNWRCPACRGYLGRGLWPRFCGKCGVGLR